ncbi:MAG TPA: CopG family transcriptional regulator [Lacipirellulaceae bacterium]|nr:CopG family transcriptional regulator [Lacipirellulaceae bacterium]
MNQVKPKTPEPWVPLHFQEYPSVLAQVDELARQRGMSRAAFIRSLIREALRTAQTESRAKR